MLGANLQRKPRHMSPPSQAELAECLVETLYRNSANLLPGICERLGLASGDRDEAMNSKRVYVRKRIAGLDPVSLRELGREVDREQPSLRLSEIVAKLDEASQPELGLIARRRIVGLFDKGGYSLSGDLRLSEFLEPIWPISKMHGPAVSIGFETGPPIGTETGPSGAVPSVRLGARREAGDVEQRRAAGRPPHAFKNGSSVASCRFRFPRWRSDA